MKTLIIFSFLLVSACMFSSENESKKNVPGVVELGHEPVSLTYENFEGHYLIVDDHNMRIVDGYDRCDSLGNYNLTIDSSRWPSDTIYIQGGGLIHIDQGRCEKYEGSSNFLDNNWNLTKSVDSENEKCDFSKKDTIGITYPTTINFIDGEIIKFHTIEDYCLYEPIKETGKLRYYNEEIEEYGEVEAEFIGCNSVRVNLENFNYQIKTYHTYKSSKRNKFDVILDSGICSIDMELGDLNQTKCQERYSIWKMSEKSDQPFDYNDDMFNENLIIRNQLNSCLTEKGYDMIDLKIF